MHSILQLLPESLQHEVISRSSDQLEGVEEIRIRIGRPVQIETQSETLELKYVPTVIDRQFVAEKISQHSFYSLEEEMKKGYVTIDGGHRVGIAGKVALD